MIQTLQHRYRGKKKKKAEIPNPNQIIMITCHPFHANRINAWLWKIQEK